MYNYIDKEGIFVFGNTYLYCARQRNVIIFKSVICLDGFTGSVHYWPNYYYIWPIIGSVGLVKNVLYVLVFSRTMP